MRDQGEHETPDAFTGRFRPTAPPVSPVVLADGLPERLPPATPLATPDDLELRTATRMWGCTVQRGLFGEWGLVVAYGGIGRTPRVLPTRWFESREALERRRRELLAIRRRHGYAVASTRWAAATPA